MRSTLVSHSGGTMGPLLGLLAAPEITHGDWNRSAPARLTSARR
jgi:hypothetical protein